VKVANLSKEEFEAVRKKLALLNGKSIKMANNNNKNIQNMESVEDKIEERYGEGERVIKH
jgi:hypothetical protein